MYIPTQDISKRNNRLEPITINGFNLHNNRSFISALISREIVEINLINNYFQQTIQVHTSVKLFNKY